MIPIKEAISSGAWLQCEHSEYEPDCQFRIKILNFRKLKFSEIDKPENIQGMDMNTVIWIMDLELINMSKVPIYGAHLKMLIIVDQDGFQFPFFDDYYLSCDSEFAKKSGLYRFYAGEMIPKVKAIGAIPFLSPDDDEAEYSISIKKGSIREA